MERIGHVITGRIINHFDSGLLSGLALLKTFESSSEEIMFDHRHHRLCLVPHSESKHEC